MKATMPHSEIPTLLIVDDEPLLTDLARQQLSKHGFQVLTANSGQEALQTVLQEAGNIRMVVTDMSMPGMSGLELAVALNQQTPPVPVLIATGYNTEQHASEMPSNVVGMVQKPYNHHQLTARIQEILQRTEP